MNTEIITPSATEIKPALSKVERTAVRYDRSAGQWQAVNGVTQTFPAGNAGKRSALLYALNHDHPQLAALVGDIAAMHNHNPQLVDRLIKAAQLLTKGHTYNNGRVKSQSAEETYQTTYTGIPCAWYCTCPDFDNGLQRQAGLTQWGGVDTDYGLMCKHTLAGLLAYLAGLSLPDEPIPFETPARAQKCPQCSLVWQQCMCR